jgi:hypothetical protein
MKENAMSCVQYENFQIETPATKPETKTFVMLQTRTAADATSRVNEALNLVLANGSMPA